MVSVKLNYTESFRVFNRISENGCTFIFGDCVFHKCGKTMSVEYIITQYQCYVIITDKIFSNDKCLRQTIR